MSKKNYTVEDFLDNEAVDVDRNGEDEEIDEDDDLGSFIDDEVEESSWSPKMVSEESENGEEIGMEEEESDGVISEESEVNDEEIETEEPGEVTPPPPLLRESSRVFVEDSSGDESEASENGPEPKRTKICPGSTEDGEISRVHGKLLRVPGPTLQQYQSAEGRMTIKDINSRHSGPRNRNRISSSSSSEDEVFPRSTVELIESREESVEQNSENGDEAPPNLEVFPRSTVQLIDSGQESSGDEAPVLSCEIPLEHDRAGTSGPGPRASHPGMRTDGGSSPTDERNNEDNEGEQIKSYLSGIKEASEVTVGDETNGRIEINIPVGPGILPNERKYKEILDLISTLLEGRPANLDFEAGLLLESNITKKLRHFYASNNTDMFRRRVRFNDDIMNEVLELLLSVNFNELCENDMEESDWTFLGGYLIGKQHLSTQSQIDSFFSCIAIFILCEERFNGKLQFVKRYRTKANRLQKSLQIRIPNLAKSDGTFDLELVTTLSIMLEKDIRIWTPITRRVTHRNKISLEQRFKWKKIHLELCPKNLTFSLIKSINAYRNVIACQFCTQRFQTIQCKIQHLRGNRCPFKSWRASNPDADWSEYFHPKTKNGKLYFCKGSYKPKPTILELLIKNAVISEKEKVDLSKELMNPYLAVFDIESMLSRMDLDPRMAHSTSIEYQQKHECMSISVCSNVPGFDRVQTLIAKEPKSGIAKELLNHLHLISEKAEEINLQKHGELMSKIRKLQKEHEEQGKGWRAKQLDNLGERLSETLRELVVLGWNSSCYDLPVLIRSSGLAYWIDKLEGKPPFALRKGPKEYLMLKTERLKFLDLLNFLGTKTTLRDYLRQMKIPNAMGKMVFPYSFASDHKKLFQSEFPPYESFYSDISQSNVLEEDWLKFKEQLDTGLTEAEALDILGLGEKPKTGKQTYRAVKKEYEYMECKYLWQFLAAYNAMDVLPLIPCSEQLRQRYFELTGLDCFSHVTISSMAFPFLVRQAYKANDEDWNYFCMLNEEAYDIVSASVMGGLSHCFNKLGLAGYTELEPHRFPPGQREKCKQIASWDANMMYTGTAGLICSNAVGPFSIRRKEKGFRQDTVMGKPRIELIWLKVMEIRRFRGKKIQTALSPYGQHSIEIKGRMHKVDGWIWWWKQGWIVLEFDGCIHHGCPFCYPNRLELNPLNGKTYLELHEETERRNEELRKHEDVTELIVMRECRFNELIRTNYKGTKDLVKTICENGVFPPAVEENISWERMGELIVEEKISGFVECSLRVPENPESYEKFSTFPPFFDKEKLNREDLLDENQKKYAVDNNLLKGKQTYLLSKMAVKNVTISSSLFVYYVKELGLEVTDVTKVLQFRRAQLMKNWLDMIIEGRKEAKANNEQTLTLAYKALGNHGYGFGLLNLLDRHEVKYVKASDKERYSKCENCKGFFECGPEGDRDLYLEFTIRKRKAWQKLPKQLSADILSCAKIPLLKCVYGMFDKYFRRTAWSLLAMDTDSVVVMEAGDTLADCCKPELRAEFEALHDTFFVPTEGSKAKELALEPLLFKQEFRADIALSLAPKLYLFINLDNLKRKMATKGFRRSRENEELLKFESFFKTLFEGQVENEPAKAVVRGMKTRQDGQMYTYMQKKRALSKLSPKFGYCEHEIHCFPREMLSNDDKTLLETVFPFQCEDEPEKIWEFVSNVVKDLSPIAKQYVFASNK